MIKNFIECGNIIYYHAQDHFAQEIINYGKSFFLKKAFWEDIYLYVKKGRIKLIFKKKYG